MSALIISNTLISIFNDGTSTLTTPDGECYEYDDLPIMAEDAYAISQDPHAVPVYGTVAGIHRSDFRTPMYATLVRDVGVRDGSESPDVLEFLKAVMPITPVKGDSTGSGGINFS